MYLQTHVSITYMYVHIHVDIYTCTMYINVIICYIVVCSTSGSQVEMASRRPHSLQQNVAKELQNGGKW